MIIYDSALHQARHIMKKHLLLFTLLGLLLPSLSASRNSWTGMYMKLLPSYSNLNLNYSGDEPYTMKLRKETSFNSYYNKYNDGFSTHTIADKVSVNTMSVDYSVGLSYEAANSLGIIGEIGGMIGKSSNFIGSNDAIIFNTFVTAGLFYHQPSFRIYMMGGFGIGEDIFGYPSAIDALENGRTAYIKENKSFVNSTVGFTYRGSIGFDYKIDFILLGISYNYTRSISHVELRNEETFYISNHAIAATIGIHM